MTRALARLVAAARGGLAAAGGCLAACGGPAAPTAAPVQTVIATPRLTPDDHEVARVNGRAVWSSCVAIQAGGIAAARAGGASQVQGPAPTADQLRREALDQCIAFELLAQAAEARGAAADPEVVSATRTAAVNRLVATDFEQRYRTPADFGPALQELVKRNEWRMHLVELRSSVFARFSVAEDAPPDLDAKAHALAERLAAELAGQTGLYGIHLTEAAERIAAGSGIELATDTVKPTHQDDLVKPYAQALYAIPAVGQTSAAVRTKWGWDVILWTGGIEAGDFTREQIEAQIVPEFRRRQFQVWSTQIGKQLGVHIELDQDNIARLDERSEATP